MNKSVSKYLFHLRAEKIRARMHTVRKRTFKMYPAHGIYVTGKPRGTIHVVWHK